jgi:poly(3-hydroxybutyrate) depolymerase
MSEGPGRIEVAVGAYVVPVWYYRPVGFQPSDPVLFVMHGVGRNADEYRDQWVALAEAHRGLLIVPEFSKAQFPGADAYNLGNVFDEAGNVRPRSEWSYAVIEPVFDEMRRRSGSTQERYALYGHSAGAQFEHRYLFFIPEARVSQVVSANAGWYTLPDFGGQFPYGLGGTAVDEATVRSVLGKPVVVLLGTADTDPDHSSLRRTPEATAQGPHRLARGENFFVTAEALAAVWQVPFGWRKRYAPGVAHSNEDMAVFAAEWLFGAKR